MHLQLSPLSLVCPPQFPELSSGGGSGGGGEGRGGRPMAASPRSNGGGGGGMMGGMSASPVGSPASAAAAMYGGGYGGQVHGPGPPGGLSQQAQQGKQAACAGLHARLHLPATWLAPSCFTTHAAGTMLMLSLHCVGSPADGRQRHEPPRYDGDAGGWVWLRAGHDARRGNDGTHAGWVLRGTAAVIAAGYRQIKPRLDCCPVMRFELLCCAVPGQCDWFGGLLRQAGRLWGREGWPALSSSSSSSSARRHARPCVRLVLETDAQAKRERVCACLPPLVDPPCSPLQPSSRLPALPAVLALPQQA